MSHVCLFSVCSTQQWWPMCKCSMSSIYLVYLCNMTSICVYVNYVPRFFLLFHVSFFNDERLVLDLDCGLLQNKANCWQLIQTIQRIVATKQFFLVLLIVVKRKIFYDLRLYVNFDKFGSFNELIALHCLTANVCLYIWWLCWVFATFDVLNHFF